MKIVLLMFIALGAMVVLFFWPAGRCDLPFAWAAIGLYGAFAVATQLAMDPELRQERLKPGAGGRDRHFRWLIAPFIVAFWVVAGLDLRRGWSPPMPVALQVAGLAGMAGSLAFVCWAMAVNRFFSPVVRIQNERGHHLITGGPYRFVRHPGYAGSLVTTLCVALAIGSWWSLAPGGVMAVMMLRRTLLEDAFLQRELPGYAEYSQRVRWRLLPGLW